MVQNEFKTKYFWNLNLRILLSFCPFLTLSCIVIAHQSIIHFLQPNTENRKFYFTFPVFHQLSLSSFKTPKCYKSSSLKSFHSLQFLPRYWLEFIPFIQRFSAGDIFAAYGAFSTNGDIFYCHTGKRVLLASSG